MSTKTEQVAALGESMKRASIVRYAAFSGGMTDLHTWAQSSDTGVRTAATEAGAQKAADALASIALAYAGNNAVTESIAALVPSVSFDGPSRSKTILRKWADKVDSSSKRPKRLGAVLSKYRGIIAE